MSVSILGGGISGLSVCHFIKKSRPNIQTQIYEKTKISGGWIASEKGDFTFELGPRSIRSGSLNRTLNIIDDLNLEDQIIYPSKDADGKFVSRNGRLVKVPSSLLEIIKEPVIRKSIPEALNFAFRKQDLNVMKNDESINDFYSKQIGPTLTNYLLRPAYVGINGSNINLLSARTIQRRLFETSQSKKRFIETLIYLFLSEKNNHPLKSKILKKGPMFSFKNGLDTLPLTLEKLYKHLIEFDSKVKAIHFSNNETFIELFDKNVMKQTDIIVSALPAFEIAKILNPHDKELAGLLNSIEYTSMACVSVGFNDDLIPKQYRGFGFLVSPKDKNPLLGATFDSVIFPDEKKQTKITFMIGGHQNIHKNIIDVTETSVETLENIAMDTLREILGIYQKPDYIKVNICKNAIPQHFVGHDKKMDKINQIMADKFPMIKLSNAFVKDVSINGCIDLSYNIANDIINNISIKK